MFSTGQWIFAALFFVGFTAVVIISYRKDLKLHRKYYKGSLYILAGFIFFILALFAIKYFLKN